MPKLIKGNAGHKPPVPSLDHSPRRQVPHLQPIVKLLDETIRATIPGLHYAVKWKRPLLRAPGASPGPRAQLANSAPCVS